MKAVYVQESLPTDHQNCFIEGELNTNVPEGRDLFVRIDGISVNPVDCKQRQLIEDRLSEPRILGWDACGEVISVGNDVENYKPGDRVIYAGDITRPGCYAQTQLVDERVVGPKPDKLTEEEAASLPLTSLAAWEGLFDRLKIDRTSTQKQVILIIGGAGGLGSMAVQLARQLSNCTVVATASREESRRWCLKMGAHHVIDHSKDLREQLNQLGFNTVPYILNCSNNAPYWETMSEIISPEGSICLVASTKAKLDLDLFMKKSVQINWELMFTRSLFSTNNMPRQGEVLRHISELVDAGIITHTKTKSAGKISASSIAKAHALVESGRMIGKVTLEGVDV
ncbi:zinc-binding alcohol dehydrogenase family protein [Kiloniella sp. EL199]|uniref:zinc-binding alcohol dehydrogenase family protein n=1 Tax=Kiloniella sp. EL199 TaxID=2107581 RepID=UPI0013C45551|nr:zinc-binding alcohol dehydrogenase family protein [Kiloniella sp. EL199]